MKGRKRRGNGREGGREVIASKFDAKSFQGNSRSPGVPDSALPHLCPITPTV